MVSPAGTQTRAGTPACALCGLPAPTPLWDREDGEKRAYCCHACLEVARLLHETPPKRADSRSASPSDEKPERLVECTLSLGGLWCSSCAWLIELALKRLPGVYEATVSFLRREARIAYDPKELDESRVLRAVRRLGYRASSQSEKKPLSDEEEALWTRLLLGGVLAMHVMLISLFLYVREGLGIRTGADLEGFFRWILLLGSAPLMAVWGLPVARAGVLALLRRRPNLPTLIALGAFAAFGLSVRNLLLGYEAVYFDTAVMLLGVVTLGHWLEVRAHRTGKKLLERLRDPLPAEARVLTPEGERPLPLWALQPGMRLRVLPGEAFPADGVVARGRGGVDESPLTGEPLPRIKEPGDPVRAGTRSLDGTFEIVASAVGEATEAGRLAQTLQRALWERAPVERLVDRLAAGLVPLALAVAGGSFLYAWSAGLGGEAALQRALAVLVIACPCALGLATPLALWAALGRAAQAGLLLKNTRVVEALARVRAVVFDKTGTLTESLTLRAVAVADPGCENEALRYAAAAEAAYPQAREHPLGKAILEAARARGVVPPPAEGARWEPGRGVGALVEGRWVWVGNRALVASKGLAVPESLRRVEDGWLREKRARAVLYVGFEGSVRALLALDEALRPEAPAAIEQLRGSVERVEVLTGDTAEAAARWAKALRVPVKGEQLPEAKARFVRALSAPVAVVGDGTNDGPALAVATVGFALSRGTEVAHTAADVLLLREDLRLVPWALRLARAALRKVKQNLGWALVYNVVGMGLAAAGNLSPVVAAAAMATSSLLVTTNALRLRRFPLPLPLSDRSPQPPGGRP